MYLKEIEASGFKSFADKLKITLDNDITCIVGPNGSGKSNVVDAVRWVLGEQSVKSLRGDGGMADVIFSGSKTRNNLNVASVSLTFDNSDHYLNTPFTEIVIKRKIYRTGENEYFLNGEKCRLKDITDLFLDSGIGKESFNIISQGEVQRILSTSSYDRRVIFEEAAGVLKYKKRKEEAIRKLDRTHNNLERVNDIIGELELQVEPLKEQSIKASEYLENKNNLEKIEVALTVYEIDLMNENYQSSKKRIEDINDKLMILRNKINDTRVDTCKKELFVIDQKINNLNRELLQITKEEERLNGEKEILKERSKYDAKDTKVHENITNLTEKKMIFNKELDVIETVIFNLEEQLKKQSSILLSKDQEIKQLENKKSDLLRDYSRLEKEQIEVKHKKDVLNDYLENGGNLPNSIKAILNNPKLNGVHQIIGSLFSTSEKYVKALEVALLSSKNFIVVENEKVAVDCVSYLKDRNLGRATFFPLNVIKAKAIDLDSLYLVQKEIGFIGICSKLIECDDLYKNIFSNQLGNVLVVDNIENANKISKRINMRYKIVTLDGDVIHVGGSITGGSLNNQKSIVSDKIELERLIRLKDSISNRIVEIKDELINMDNLINNEVEKTNLIRKDTFGYEEDYNNKRQSRDIIKENLLKSESELNSLTHLINDSLSEEEEKVMKLYYEATSKKEKTSLSYNSLLKEKDELQKIISELEAVYKIDNSSIRVLETELKSLEINISKMDIKFDYYLNTLSEDYEMTYERAKNEYKLEIDIEDAREKVSTYKNNIKKIGMVNIASIEEYEKVSTRFEFLSKQKEDLLNAKDTLLEIIDEMDEVMKEEFFKTFKLIEEEFKNVFKQLFKGGVATLKLTDPNNILETGVDIIASPPGKKLTTISLLSGGEKTLTAISLLFAILNVKTVPFCLFDEVEAALDEANVDQFGKYLDHYKNKTQFLLITHKKKTMEYANTLYGITMQESGVSKLVSVKFDQNNQ